MEIVEINNKESFCNWPIMEKTQELLSSDLKALSGTKIILYSRFIIFTFAVVYFLGKIEKKINIYIKFLTFLIFFLIIDSLIQFYFGKDLFGYEYNNNYFRISGPFGDEWIIGTYLLYIGFLTLALVNFFYKIDFKYNILFILLVSFTILYTGERAAFFSIFYFFIFMFIFSKKKYWYFIKLY